MFTLAHFSDPHLGPLPTPKLTELFGKRFFGYLSWQHRRRKIHRPGVLAKLAVDLAAQAPDHVAITGDLANISLPGEFVRIAQWLRQLGDPNWITVIPGNHDAYVDIAWDRSIGLWSDFFASDGAVDAAPRSGGAADFPIVRRRGDVALIGLNSARPRPIAYASGALGSDQLRKLEKYLETLGGEGLFRVVLLHHPPQIDGASWRKRLEDAEAFRAVIARAGAELVLHGHNHEFAAASLGAGKRQVPVFGVPSASAARIGKRPQAHYHIFRIFKTTDGWQMTKTVRGLDTGTGGFVDMGSEPVPLAPQG